MSSKTISVSIDLNRGNSKKEAAQFRTDQQQLNKDLLTDAEGNERAKSELAKKTGKEKVRAATEAQVATVSAAKKEAAAMVEVGTAAEVTAGKVRRVGQEGAKGFTAMGLAAGAAQAGFTKILSIIGDIGRAMTDAAQKRKALGAAFGESRDSLAELSTLMGRENDDKFTLDIGRFGKQARMNGGESRAFLTELYNSGAQYKGTNIGDKEFDQYAQQMGQLAVAKGMNKEQAGDLGGTVLGFTDFKKYGDRASEEALGRANSAVSILGRGKGRNSVLANQFNMLASATLNEDDMKGVFQNSDEVAMVVSTMAEKHDAQAAELAKMAIRGMRGFDKKQGPLLKKADVNAQTPFVEAIEKIAPVLEQEAKDKRIKMEDAIRLHFDDEGTVDAINVAINKGVYGGVFKDRREFGKTVAGPKPALDAIDKMVSSKVGLAREAAADIDLAKLEKGQKTDELQILRNQAVAKMIRSGELDATDAKVKDYLVDNISFGILGGAEQRRIDKTVMATLYDRAPKEAMVREDYERQYAFTPEQMEGKVEALSNRIRRAGGDPMREVGRDFLPDFDRGAMTKLPEAASAVPIAGPVPAPFQAPFQAPAAAPSPMQAPDMKETNRLLKTLVDQGEKKQAGERRVAPPLVPAPPVMRR